MCSKCGKPIKNIDKKLNLTAPNGVVMHCCSKSCKTELERHYEGYSKERMAFIAEVVFGLAGMAMILMNNKIAAQILIGIDAVIFLLFPYASFNPKLRVSYDESKRQSRNIAVSLLLIVAVWFYFFVYKAM